MAKIVDKEQKKRDIALACRVPILQNGVQELTVAQLAEAAAIGKGTIYEYFDSKEDILFELALILMQEHKELLRKELEKSLSCREKIKIFAAFYYDEKYADLREIYKQFIAISLLHPQPKMLEFNERSISEYRQWFEEIVLQGIDSGELKESAASLVEGLFSVGDGLFLQSSITGSTKRLRVQMENHIDALFEIMEKKR